MNDDPELLTSLSLEELGVLADGMLAPAPQARLDQLLDKLKESALSGHERQQLDRMLRSVDQLTILKARARYTLSRLKVGLVVGDRSFVEHNRTVVSSAITKLHWASEHAPAAVRMLLDRGAAVNSRNLKADSQLYGMTPLIMNATQKNDCAEVTELLIKAGADIAAVDANGKTALAHAQQHGLTRLQEVLLGHGAG